MYQSNRLNLYKPTVNDFQKFYEIHSDPQTNLFNPNGPMSLETAEIAFTEWLTHWDNHNFGCWTIKLKQTDSIIGFGGLSYRLYGNEIKLNLGYRFDKMAWGKGFATEFSRYSIEYGFQELNVDTIFAVVRPKHSVSIKVLEKCNMTLFGRLDDVPNQENSLVYFIKK